jgi:hypothetical protein
MYLFTIPDDVDLVDTATEKPIQGQKLKFVETARTNWLTDRRFTANNEALEQAQAIREALRGKGPGDVIELHNNDYALLAEVVKKPEHGAGQQVTSGYGPQGHLVLPFIQAVLEATKKEKAKAVKKVEPASDAEDDS